MTKLFVEQPPASSGSANYKYVFPTNIVSEILSQAQFEAGWLNPQYLTFCDGERPHIFSWTSKWEECLVTRETEQHIPAKLLEG